MAVHYDDNGNMGNNHVDIHCDWNINDFNKSNFVWNFLKIHHHQDEYGKKDNLVHI